MIFEKTNFEGVHIVKLQVIADERGFFARSWCKNEFSEHGLDTNCLQMNISFNKCKGTLRGMHYQVEPYGEVKIVRCTRGAIYDVIIDLRKESKTYLMWMSVELNDENREMIYIPKGFAHGFLTLQDDTEVCYQMSENYSPNAARGIRFDDPDFKIQWPSEIKSISDKDSCWPDFRQQCDN